jgi:hypothetical protein
MAASPASSMTGKSPFDPRIVPSFVGWRIRLA